MIIASVSFSIKFNWFLIFIWAVKFRHDILRNLNRQNPSCMKRVLVIVLLVACMAAVAFASLSTRKQQDGVKKTEKKEVKEKKVKKHGCWLST
jgi:Tfp pilus assembly protein PilO